jgi:hypothetical protein
MYIDVQSASVQSATVDLSIHTVVVLSLSWQTPSLACLGKLQDTMTYYVN